MRTVAITAVLLVICPIRAEELKSGPQVGDKLPGAFHPLNVTGPEAGKKNCLVCQNGQNPVAMIFAREIDPNLAALIKKIDKATADNKKCEMGSFVVFCTPDEEIEKPIKDLAAKEAIKECILAIDNPAGPRGYNLAKEAHITVVLYVNREIKVNYAFKKGQFKAEDVEKILKDLPKITTVPVEE
jgi:hypothetical protein